MHSGSELVETWTPVGGFKVERRKVRIPDGGATVTERLVPKWEIDDLMADRPCARQPCLHRIVADCPPEKDAILDLAGRFGLLTVSLTRTPEPGKPVPSSILPPEPLDIWRTEIRELKAVGDLWDRIAAGDRRGEEMLERKLASGLARSPFHLAAARENGSGFRMRYRKPVPSALLPPEPVEVWKATIRELRSAAELWDRIAAGDTRGRELFERKLAVNLARAPFHLTAVDGDGGPFRLRYCPPDLRAALWQRLAGEAAGLMRCVRCPPSCGRWFLAGKASRSDRQFCSDRCRVRAFRKRRNGDSLEHVTAVTPGEG